MLSIFAINLMRCLELFTYYFLMHWIDKSTNINWLSVWRCVGWRTWFPIFIILLDFYFFTDCVTCPLQLGKSNNSSLLLFRYQSSFTFPFQILFLFPKCEMRRGNDFSAVVHGIVAVSNKFITSPLCLEEKV